MFNQLNPAELERLAIMSEELSELATVAHFISLEGLTAKGMDTDHQHLSNLELLELELTDCMVIIDYMALNNDLTDAWFTQTSKCNTPNQTYIHLNPNILANSMLMLCLRGIKFIDKIIRHGYESFSPFDETRTTDRQNLTYILTDLNHLRKNLLFTNTINIDHMCELRSKKIEKIRRYLHEQTVFVVNDKVTDQSTPTI